MTKTSSLKNKQSEKNAQQPEQNPGQSPNTDHPKIIFFGNGPLAEAALAELSKHSDIIFHAHSQSDLAEAARLKREHPDAFGILASFGVLIRPDFLELFEPEGIINLHPSLLPKYRGASPIESAILAGDRDFSYSIMKLAKKMDAGPIYYQTTLENLPLDKSTIYHELATHGARWITEHLPELRQLTPTPQDDTEATFTQKLDKSMSMLHPESHTAHEILRQIIAYQGYPKPKYNFYDKICIILDAHYIDVADVICDAAASEHPNSPLMFKCADRNFVVVDRLQPEGKRPMDAMSFVNGLNGLRGSSPSRREARP